jgi:hypothetical protein
MAQILTRVGSRSSRAALAASSSYALRRKPFKRSKSVAR